MKIEAPFVPKAEDLSKLLAEDKVPFSSSHIDKGEQNIITLNSNECNEYNSDWADEF